MLVTVIPHVDPVNDTVVFIMDLTGNDPFQHEFLKEVFADALATTDDEDGEVHGKALGPDDLRVRIPIKTVGAFARASHTMENRRRVEMGLPTIEQEAAQKVADAKAAQDAATADAKAKTLADEKVAADRKQLASDVADELIARKAAG